MNFDLHMMPGIGSCIKTARRCRYVHDIVVVKKHNIYMVSQTLALWWNRSSFIKSKAATSTWVGLSLAASQASFNRIIAPFFPLSSCQGQPIAYYQTHHNVLYATIERSNSAYRSLPLDINVSFKVFVCIILAMYCIHNKYSIAICVKRSPHIKANRY